MAAPARDLIERAVGGDPGAIDQVLRQARTDIRRYARRSCRSPSDAEDAVQETLIALYRKIGALRQVVALSAWLARIVDRYCLRLARRLAGLQPAREAEIDRRIAEAPAAELRIDIARAIESLPGHYRQVVILRDVEELTIDEIGERLGATRETVKARLHRARAMMRDYLAGGD
jgi:RNA polymerase sigma-70 factor (ECF subfamily)